MSETSVLPTQFEQALAISSPTISTEQIKELTTEFFQWMRERFNSDDVNDLVSARAYFVDLLLSKLWSQHHLDEYQIALFAVGGYGRAELHPHSDVDILLLIQEHLEADLEEKISTFIAQLWDIKLDVGSSVRSVNDCLTQAQNDITIATNLMESRLICGNQALGEQLKPQLHDASFWPSAEFFKGKCDEQDKRHSQYHGAAYNLEPNLKANPGGLRDIQTIAWVAKKHFVADNLQDLVEHRYLTRNEYFELQECQDYLWRMRFALHLVANRSENRLLFDYQTDVAKLMGFGDEGKAPVERMMKRFYRVINRVTELNEILLQHFEQVILKNNLPEEVTPLSNNFEMYGNLIRVTNERVFLRPDMSIRLFIMIAENPKIKGIHADTLRLLRNARRRLISGLNDYAECRRLFIELIKHPRGLGRAFTLMYKYSVLGAYLPEWRSIVGQMQFDLFHAYSVDEHSYRLIKNLYRFSQPEHNNEFPLCSKLVQRIRKPEVLFLAGIFHDIAKGRGGDHSELGAVDALNFSKMHNLNVHDGKMIAWLVKNHLIMSVTAQRKDISDFEVIKAFADLVRDEAHLDYLYCLTVADMRATNESLWNSWKANLLEELYFSTKRALRRGMEKPVDVREKIRENQAQALELLVARGIEKEHVNELWKQYKADYFLRYSPQQIAWHTSHIINHDRTLPLVLISPKPYRGGTEVFIYTAEKQNIFASTAALLGSKKLSIHDAKVLTSKDGFTLNTFVVLEGKGLPIRDTYRALDVKQALEAKLNNDTAVEIKTQPVSKRVQQFKVKVQVSFIETKNKNRTLLEIVSVDRPGLLACLSQVFQDAKVSIHNAKITTFGERVEDLFTVSNADNKALSDNEQELLEQQIKQVLA